MSKLKFIAMLACISLACDPTSVSVQHQEQHQEFHSRLQVHPHCPQYIPPSTKMIAPISIPAFYFSCEFTMIFGFQYIINIACKA